VNKAIEEIEYGVQLHNVMLARHGIFVEINKPQFVILNAAKDLIIEVRIQNEEYRMIITFDLSC
jgi:hypothetical protein